MSDYDDSLIEKTAEAMVKEANQFNPASYTAMARAVLDAVAPTIRADAWDEGRAVGHEDTYLNLIEGRGDFDAAETPNPYRSDDA